jgi:hypothetical protein
MNVKQLAHGRIPSDIPCPIRKSNSPLIVRTTSEDMLTANVFGILKSLDPKTWLTSLPWTPVVRYQRV